MMSVFMKAVIPFDCNMLIKWVSQDGTTVPQVAEDICEMNNTQMG